MPSADAAAVFLTILNGLHPSLSFKMELPVESKSPFIDIDMDLNLKLKCTENQETLGCFYSFTDMHTDKRYYKSLS